MSVLLESVTAPNILQVINQFLSEADKQWLKVQLDTQQEEPSLSLKQKQDLADEVFGSWANDDSIPAIFQEIEEQRALSRPRKISYQLSQEAVLSLKQKRDLIDELCGSWSHDDSIPAIFKEIEEQRTLSQPREVSFQ